MNEAVIEYRDEDTELVFRWHGGVYINVGRYAGYEDGAPYFEAFEVINVWDDEHEVSDLDANGPWDVNHDAGEWEYLRYLDSARRPLLAILERFEFTCKRFLAEQMADVSEDA